MKVEVGKRYQFYKNLKPYNVIHLGKMQLPEGTWICSVTYQNDDMEVFTRAKDSFEMCFTEVIVKSVVPKAPTTC